MLGGWSRRKSTSTGTSTASGGKGVRAKRAKAKLRREWRDWWFTPQPGAAPPKPKDSKTPKGKKQRQPSGDTPKSGGGQETSAAPPDVTTKPSASNDGGDGDFGYDDCGFPVNIPDSPRTSRAGSTERAMITDDEAAASWTGPPPKKGQAVPDVPAVPNTAIERDQASAYFLANQRNQEDNARAWAASAQEHRDQAAALAAADAENETNEHEGTIQRLHQIADGHDQTATFRQAAADAWGERALNPFGDVRAKTSA